MSGCNERINTSIIVATTFVLKKILVQKWPDQPKILKKTKKFAAEMLNDTTIVCTQCNSYTSIDGPKIITIDLIMHADPSLVLICPSVHVCRRSDLSRLRIRQRPTGWLALISTSNVLFFTFFQNWWASYERISIKLTNYLII